MAVLVCLALVPPLVLWVLSDLFLWLFICGGATWIVAVIIKFLFARMRLIKTLMQSGFLGAMTWGLFSGLAELGIFLLFAIFFLTTLDFSSGIVCGLGAASVEVVYLIIYGAVEEYKNPDTEKYKRWLSAARRSHWVANVAVIERGSASLIHVVSRGAIVLSLQEATWWPGLVALVMFVLVDGTATYGVSQDWDWFDPYICRRYYLGVIFVGVIGMVLLAILVIS